MELSSLRSRLTASWAMRDKILSEARKLDIDLMVVGGHQDRLRHLISGDVVKDLLNGATCPVVVVPPAEN